MGLPHKDMRPTHSILTEKVQSLLQKQVIQIVHGPVHLGGFFSKSFLIQKRGTTELPNSGYKKPKWPLNTTAVLSTTHIIYNVVGEQIWLVIDLKAAFSHLISCGIQDICHSLHQQSAVPSPCVQVWVALESSHHRVYMYRFVWTTGCLVNKRGKRVTWMLNGMRFNLQAFLIEIRDVSIVVHKIACGHKLPITAQCYLQLQFWNWVCFTAYHFCKVRWLSTRLQV